MKRRTFLAAAAAATMIGPMAARASQARVSIGFLFPLSGPDGALGRSLRDAGLLAIEEVNAAHSGRRPMLGAMVHDTGSDPGRFIGAASYLVSRERVASVFGLCPPSARPTMLQLLEQTDSLFWDPAPTPGGECSKNVIHGGPTPHQNLKHLIPWMADEIGSGFLFLGTEEPCLAEHLRVGRMIAKTIGAHLHGPTELFPPGHSDFAPIIRRIGSPGVEAVVCALSGPSLGRFLRQYREAGLDPLTTPIASIGLSELEVAAAGPKLATGLIAAQPYFAAWPSPTNSVFLQKLRRRRHGSAGAHAMAEAVWFQIHQLGQALDSLGDGDIGPATIREAAKDRSVAAPGGRVRIEPDSLHTELWPKIAMVESSGRFRVLARTSEPVPALPYWGWPGKACTEMGLWATR